MIFTWNWHAHQADALKERALIKVSDFNITIRQLQVILVQNTHASAIALRVSNCHFSRVELGLQDIGNHALEAH